MAPNYSDLKKQHELYFKESSYSETRGLKIEAGHTQKSSSKNSQNSTNVKTDSKFTLHNKKSTLTIDQNYKFSNQISAKLKLDPSKYTIETLLTSKSHPTLGVCQFRTSKSHNSKSVFNLVGTHKCMKNRLVSSLDCNGNISTVKFSLNDGKISWDCKDIGLHLVHKVGKTKQETHNNLQASAIINQNIGPKNIIIGAKIHPFNNKKSEAVFLISTFTSVQNPKTQKLTEKLKTRTLINTDFHDKQLISYFNQATQHLSVMTALEYSILKKQSLASLAIVNTGKHGLNQHFRLYSDGKIGYSHSINVSHFRKYAKSSKLTIGGETVVGKNGKWFEMPKIGVGLKFTI